MAPRGLPLALLLSAAYALHTPPCHGLRKRGFYRTQTQYKTDSADGDGSLAAPAISVESETAGIDARARAAGANDALRARAVDALRAKGDAAAVDALRADIEDIVVKIDGVDVDVTSRDGGVLAMAASSSSCRLRVARGDGVPSTPSSRRGERDTVASMA